MSDEARELVLDRLSVELGDSLVGSCIDPGVDITVRVTSEVWADTAAFLKTGLGFGYFSFLSAIDWMPSPFGRDMDSQVDIAAAATTDPAGAGGDKELDPMEQGVAGGDTRFQLLARVNDIVSHRSITLKADVPDSDLSVPSWVSVYAGANWHEREAWEMFGIVFVGHPGLRHIYLPAEFEGNPLRKDYPLLARRVKPWPGLVDVELMPGDAADDSGDDAADDSGGAAAPAAPGESKDS